MTNTNVFQVKPYKWHEFALLYLPVVKPSSAGKRLRRWVNKNPALKSELIQSGWTPRSHWLTPSQVQLLVSYLGEP